MNLSRVCLTVCCSSLITFCATSYRQAPEPGTGTASLGSTGVTFDVLHTTDLSTEMKTDKHEFYSDGYECFVDLEYSGGSAPSVTDFGKTPGQTGIHLTTLSFTDAVVEDVDTTVYHEIQQTGAQGQMGPVDINALQVGDVVEIHEKVSYFFSIKCSF